MQYKHNQQLVPFAKELRKNMTKEERHLWYDFLKELSVTVNRQKVIGDYIVDFYCSSAKVVIEATQNEYKYATNILDAVYDLEDKEGLVAIGSDGQLYTEDSIREYRYSGSNPKNYVWFNCADGYTKGSEHCEKWRIITCFTIISLSCA